MSSIKKISAFSILILLIIINANSQQTGKAKIAVIQAEKLPNQDPFMNSYDHSKVRLQMKAHLDNILSLFEEAGEMGADLVCGPEDIQNIGSYGLYIDTKDPVTGEILFNSLAETVPGPLTNRLAEIAKKYGMYIIAPLYESSGGKIFNTAVIFDRHGNIVEKHRKNSSAGNGNMACINR